MIKQFPIISGRIRSLGINISSLAGCSATSNVSLAYKHKQARIVGTMSHAYILSFEKEFKEFANTDFEYFTKAIVEKGPDSIEKALKVLNGYGRDYGKVPKELQIEGLKKHLEVEASSEVFFEFLQ